MGPSSIPAAVAIPVARAPARLRPWAALVDALDLTLARPSLWGLGALGFLLRGGIVLLLVPLVAVPSPVEARLLIGDGLGSNGFTPGLAAIAATVGVVVAMVLLGAMLLLAWLELWAFERTAGPGLAERLGRGGRRQLVSWLFVVQAVTLLLIGAATLPLVAQATSVAYQEILSPTGAGPLYQRVLWAVEPQMFVLGATILAAELLSAVASRTWLARAAGVPAPPGRRRWRPIVAIVGWTVSLGVLAPALWLLGSSWRWVKQTLLGAGGSQAEPLGIVLAVALLAAVWAATLVLAGFASALRGALWSVQELR